MLVVFHRQRLLESLRLLAVSREPCLHYVRRIYRRSFSSDDTFDRFKRVRDALPPKDNFYDDLLPSLESTSISREEKVDDSGCSSSGSSLLKEVPLEDIEDAVLQFVPENIKSGNIDDECLTPGQAFYLENKDKIFENIRKRYYEETKGAENVELTDSEIESLLPLLMEEEKFGSYDPNPVVPPSKHHLWDYNTNDIYIPKKAIHLHKGQMPTLQEVVDILEQVSLMR